MKIKLVGILTLLCVAFFANAQKVMPSVELKDLDGKIVNITNYTSAGKITVVSFWATWCSPCKQELDAVNDIYEDWQKKYGAQLVAVSVDDARSVTKIKPMVAQKGWEFIVLSDSNKQMQQVLNFQSVPQTFLVDQNGEIVYSHTGYVPGDELELEKHIEELATKK
ncbi:MAG: TlpA family protein disulfide reductase [Saprospiraceae bacterium]|nr:TlpA family protein disulfide reductase [Saprospiraceae bacterium]